MIGQILFYNKLMEVSPEYVVNLMMTSKKKSNPRAIARAARILKQMSSNIVKKKGVRVAITKNIDAIHQATRYPPVKKAIDIINMTEPHYQALPGHPGRWA